jgi:hypothetical protein
MKFFSDPSLGRRDNRDEVLGFKRGPTDETSIDIRHPE